MKTFYTVNYVTANYNDFDVITGYTTHIIAVESTLFDALSHFDEEENDFDSGYHIRRFVETTILNTTTNTWEIVTEEREVVYYPNVFEKPEISDPWNISPF